MRAVSKVSILLIYSVAHMPVQTIDWSEIDVTGLGISPRGYDRERMWQGDWECMWKTNYDEWSWNLSQIRRSGEYETSKSSEKKDKVNGLEVMVDEGIVEKRARSGMERQKVVVSE